jgi:hypothetical protein
MSVPYSEMIMTSCALYRLLCDVGPMASSEPVLAGVRRADSKVGSEAKRAFYAARAERSAALAPQLAALKQHLAAAHEAANKIVEAFSLQKMAIRRKLTAVHTAMTQARKEGWMPKACFPPLKGSVKPAELDAAIEVFCKGMPAEAKEELSHALTAVYSAIGALAWMAKNYEQAPVDEERDLFRQAFAAVLMCKGILGKADKGIEKMWHIIKICLDSEDLMDAMSLDDLGQMMEILETMEGVLEGCRPVAGAGVAEDA